MALDLSLNPCPICGVKAELIESTRGRYYATCAGEGCIFGPTLDSAAAATEIWNRLRLAPKGAQGSEE